MDVGRWMVFAGIALTLLGLAWMVLSKLGFGRLPGDISIQRPGFSLNFPIVTSIVLSILLTIALNIVFRRR